MRLSFPANTIHFSTRKNNDGPPQMDDPLGRLKDFYRQRNTIMISRNPSPEELQSKMGILAKNYEQPMETIQAKFNQIKNETRNEQNQTASDSEAFMLLQNQLLDEKFGKE